MRPALLLVDLQADFLNRPGLTPAADTIVDKAAQLLSGCRELKLPVFHAHTLVKPDGSNRMPHWKAAGTYECVEGTAGAVPPRPLLPLPDERIFSKQFFSPFHDGSLLQALRESRADHLIVAGVYLHSCVRNSIIDAYTAGLIVWVADDALGTTEPLHGEVTRRFFEKRAATFLHVAELLHRLGRPHVAAPDEPGQRVAAACIANRQVEDSNLRAFTHLNPSDQNEVIARVPIGNADLVRSATTAAANAYVSWGGTDPAERAALLLRWQGILESWRAQLAAGIAREIGKPIVEAEEELNRAIAHLQTAIGFCVPERNAHDGSRAQVRYRPCGVIALITPWNNPLAIPVGKIAPALALGNAVVWKPSPQAPQSSLALMDTLIEARLPAGVVNLVFGDASTARHLVNDTRVDRVSMTGSIPAGRSVAACCALDQKPLQAELGANNAAIVLADCDLATEMPGLATAAFSFAGQRCTAIRRFIVEAPIYEQFSRLLRESAQGMRLGHPDDPRTQIGPLISMQQLQRTLAAIQSAVSDGAELYAGGELPSEPAGGCWLAPALIRNASSDSAIVQLETFGPVAVILKAGTEQEAVELANGVQQGLLASIHTRDPERARRIAARLQVGIIKLHAGPIALDPEAPFGGWKNSGMGPPEHGISDREFYARVQTVYSGGSGNGN